MKKILLTCFLALPCLFQKAKIKLKAIKGRLGFLSPSNNATQTYFAVGVFHLAKRSVFREAYLEHQVVLLSPVSLILLLLCCSSPSLSLVAQSPGADSLPTSIGPHRGGEARSDTFLENPGGAEISMLPLHYSSLSTVDGGPILWSLGNETASLRASARSDAQLHQSLVLNPAEASDTCAEQSRSIRHRTSVIKLNFGLVESDQDMRAGEGAFSLQSAPFPVLTSPINSRRETHRQITKAQSLASPVLSEVEACVLCLESSNGLINRDQDMRAGEGAFSLQSAPFPVFASKGKNAKHGTYARNDNNLRSTLASIGGKLDGSAIRQEKQDFTFVPNLLSSRLDSSFLFLRVEIESSQANPSQQVSITLSSQELDARHEYLLQVEDSMILSPGEFLEGAKGLQIGESKIPLQTGFGRLRIKIGGQSMLQDIWVQPNDSLRVTLDPRTGKLLFLGPHKNKFRLQVQLQDLASAWIKSINPIMLTSNKERLLDSPEKRTHYQTLSDNQALGWNRKLELLTEDSERLGRARFLLTGTREDHPVFEELKRYREDLEPDFYNWLWLYWKGKLRKHALDFMVLTQANSPEWGQQLLEYGLEEEELKRIRALEEFPMEFAEALYIENFLLEIYSGIPFADLTETLPVDLKNQVNAFFLVRQYKELAAPDSLISELIEKTANSWVRNYLQGLLITNLRGSEFINEPFWNERGESVYPESWKGKLVFLDFWLSGCGACMAFAKNKFHPLLEEFGTHPDILFVTITGDSDMELWKTSLSKNLFTTASAQNLYAAGVTHPALRKYHIQAFPEQMLLDKEGRILQVGGFPSDLDGWRQLLQSYLTQDTLSNQVLTQPQTN